jgi:enoyl-CoA hydratase/carnithine racemase
MTERIVVEVNDGIAEVRLNRPDKINALDPEMFAALARVGEALKRRPEVRAVVLSGAGRGFCAGIDVTTFASLAGGPGAGGPGAGGPGAGGPASAILATDGRITHLGQQAAWVWTELDVPVIAAIHGVCLGGGLQIALGADIRLVAPDASLAVLEIRWGIVPDMTASLRLPALVGLDVAKELYWTGRMVAGTEAVALGLATRTADDPRAAALELAARIAGHSPDAVRAGKRLLSGLGDRSTAQQLALEREEITALLGRPNQREAVAAYQGQRPPVFD